jgi:hypothetical protein
MNQRIASLAAGLLFALSAQAQAPAAQTTAAAKPLVLKAAHLFDGLKDLRATGKPLLVVKRGEAVR